MIQENIRVLIEGDNNGLINVGGNNNVLINANYGNLVINVEQHPQVKPRSKPILQRPRPFPGFLNRTAEIGTAITSLQSATSVEFYGRAGLGKSTLLRHLAYNPSVSNFSGGVVYISAYHQPLTDLLQSLFDIFYESDIPFKPSEGQLRQALYNKQVVILVDDLDLSREEVGMLLDIAPSCIFLLASLKRHLWGEGRAIPLPGLPFDAALRLIERELNRPLTEEECSTAKTLCKILDGHPLHLLQAVALVREKSRSLLEVTRQAHAASPSKALATQIWDFLSEPEQQILGTLAALNGTPLHIEHLAALTKFSNPTPILQRLQQLGLVEIHNLHYGLTDIGLAQNWLQEWKLTRAWAERTLIYFTTWAEHHQQHPDRLLEEADILRQMLTWAVKAERWQEALRLARTIEGVLALDGRWGAWEQVLEGGLQASRALKDPSTEAWALHQLGTRSFCLADTDTAHTLLSQAFRLRETLGEHIGAAVTQHNLNLLLPPLPPVHYPQPSPHLPLLPITLITGGVSIFLLALGTVLWVLFMQPSVRLTPNSWGFGSQIVGTSSAPQPIELTNDGLRSLTIKTISVGGSNPNDFYIINQNCTNVPISPDSSCLITISFAPKSSGSLNANLIIVDNSTNNFHSVSLTGNGVIPTPTPTPTFTATPTPTNMPTSTPTFTPTQTETPTITPTFVLPTTSTPISTETPLPPPTPTDTPIFLPTPTEPPIPTPTEIIIPTPIPTPMIGYY